MTAPISSTQPNTVPLRQDAPWHGNLSVAEGLALIDAKGVCWGIVFSDESGLYDHVPQIVEAVNSHASLKARIEELEAALRGNDPEMPDPITPIGWLKTMIDECRRIGPELPEDADPSSWYEMINEVQELHDRARTLIQSKGEK